MINKWKVLEEEDVSPNKWLPVFKHKIQLANNLIIHDYYTAKFGNVVMVLPFTSIGEIILVKQYKHGIGEILMELPAGGHHEQMSIEESALTELEEETGIKTTINNLISLGTIANNPTKTNHVTYGFIAQQLKFNSQQLLDVTEDIEIMRVAPKDVLRMVSTGEIWVGDTVSFILKAYILFPALFK